MDRRHFHVKYQIRDGGGERDTWERRLNDFHWFPLKCIEVTLVQNPARQRKYSHWIALKEIFIGRDDFQDAAEYSSGVM